MKRTLNLSLAVAMFSLLSVGCIRRSPKEKNLLLAKVGRQEIRASDFRAELERTNPALRSKYLRNRRALLDEMIEEELLYQRGLQAGLDQEPELKTRLARVKQDIAIDRFKQIEVYPPIKVTEAEIETRYRQEVARPQGATLVKTVLYLSSLPEGEAQSIVNEIGRGVEEGLSFPEIARKASLPYESVELDSVAFRDLDQQVQKLGAGMENRTGRALALDGTVLLLFRDAEPLYGRVVRGQTGERRLRTSCYRRIRGAILDEKREADLRTWLRSRRESSAIQIYQQALEDLTQGEEVAAEVNGVPITVREVLQLLEGLSPEEKRDRMASKRELLDDAIDRELLRQAAFAGNLQESNPARKELARQTHRLLVDLVVEREVSGITPAAREESLRTLVARLREAADVKIVAENLKKMYIPASKEIEELFGSESL